MGKHSGRHAFKERIKELGYELTEESLNKAFNRFKKVADKKKEIFDEDIEAIVADEVLRIEPPERNRLVSLHIASGTGTVPTAEIEMEIQGRAVKATGTGDGPVDAVYKTIKSLTETKSRLLKYSVNAITGGTDAQGEVGVRLREDDCIALGQGSHTDIIVASAKAYINALNKLEHMKSEKRKRGI